jgi:hypothetical protein
MPSTVAAGDVAFFFVHSLANGALSVSSGPAGFTQAYFSGSGFVTTALYYRVLNGNEANQYATLSLSGGTGANNNYVGQITVWHGVSNTTPYEQLTANKGQSSTSLSGSAITTTVANDQVVTFWGMVPSSGTADPGSTPSSGWTNRSFDTWATIGKAPTDDLTKAVAGAVAAETRTTSYGTWASAITLALEPGTYSPPSGGAPSFVSAGANTYVTGTGITSMTAAYPSSPVAGNYAFVSYTILDQNCATITWSTPSGWTVVGTLHNSCANSALFYKKLDGTESGSFSTNISPSPNCIGAGCGGSAQVSYWTGMKQTGAPYETLATAGAWGSATVASTAITTTGANELAVNFTGIIENGSGALTPNYVPMGWVANYSNSGAAGVTSQQLSMQIADSQAVTTAATTPTTSRALGNTVGWEVFSLALLPAAAATNHSHSLLGVGN